MTTGKNIRKKKDRRPELKVVFDSNVLFSQTGSYLLKHEVYDLVTTTKHDDLIITWCLPEVVRHERQYQLQKQSLDLLPSIEKLEKLLGHNLLITEQIIIQRVQEGIEKQITEQRINILSLEPSIVNWQQLALDSAYRRAPFSAGEKEKGFRDALIAETFYQLVGTSNKSAAVCRIVLVTDDGRLREAVESRTADATNVRICQNLEELKSLINTLVSQVALEFVEEIKEKASRLFFDSSDSGDSLYSKENILRKIIEKFGDKVDELPAGADERKQVKTLVGGSRFIKKDRQRIYWVNRVVLRIAAFKNKPIVPATYRDSTQTGYAGFSGYSVMPDYPVSPLKNIDIQGWQSATSFDPGSIPDLSKYAIRNDEAPLWAPQSKTLYQTGHIIFEVTWSVVVTTAKKLTKPTIESLKYVETTWEPA